VKRTDEFWRAFGLGMSFDNRRNLSPEFAAGARKALRHEYLNSNEEPA
jgi:hypothetical protein